MFPIKRKEKDGGREGIEEKAVKRGIKHVKKVPFIFSCGPMLKHTPIFSLILRITVQVVYSLDGKDKCHILLQ